MNKSNYEDYFASDTLPEEPPAQDTHLPEPQRRAAIPDLTLEVGLCQCGCGKPAPIATKTSSHYDWVKGKPKRFISGHNGAFPREATRYGEIDGEPVVFISLGKGREAIVDLDLYPHISMHRWGYCQGYACRYEHDSQGRTKLIKLHQDLFWKWGDHKNRNKLDNRRSNFRAVTRIQNAQNHGVRKDNSTGIRGVSFHALTGKYQVQINHAGKREYLGLCDTLEQAVAIRREASMRLHGDYMGAIER